MSLMMMNNETDEKSTNSSGISTQEEENSSGGDVELEVNEEEEKIVNRNPVVVYNISTIIEYSDHNFTEKIEKFLEEFSHNYDIHMNADWLEYWQHEGEMYLLSCWQRDYKTQLANELEEWHRSKSEKENTTIETIRISEELLGNRKNFDELYQNLWLRYRDQVYQEQYLMFSELYYSRYGYIRQTFQYSLKSLQNSGRGGETSDTPDIWTELYDSELERQKLDLGLPLEFSSGGPRRLKYQMNGGHMKRLDYYYYQKRSELNSEDVDIMEQLTSVELEEDCCEDTNCKQLMMNEEPEEEEENAEKILKKKKRKNSHLVRLKVPSYILDDKNIRKFWRRRFSLFSLFDRGIRLDREGWFSATPEKIAKHLARRLSCNILVEGCCGCGSNAIQFAFTCQHVIAIDNNAERLAMAKHNAEIYGVADKIEFILADFFDIAASGRLKADVVFLSPPWGGPLYKQHEDFDIEQIPPFGAAEWMRKARCISENVALFLPRNANVRQMVRMAGHGQRCEIIHNYLDRHLVAISALYGDDIVKDQRATTVVQVEEGSVNDVDSFTAGELKRGKTKKKKKKNSAKSFENI